MQRTRQEHLTDIFRAIHADNPKAILSGSLALFHQNLKLDRTPNDIDIYIPFGEKFKPLKDTVQKDIAIYLNNSWSEAKGQKNNRISYEYSGVMNEDRISFKIDVFQPTIDGSTISIVFCNGILCEHYADILKYKMVYALNGEQKHESDINFILRTNSKKAVSSSLSINVVKSKDSSIKPSNNLKSLYDSIETNSLEDFIVAINNIPYQLITSGSKTDVIATIRKKDRFHISITTFYVDTNELWTQNINPDKNYKLSIRSKEFDD